jgi:uncharacterized membrane protein YjgN (DUF898 family)
VSAASQGTPAPARAHFGGDGAEYFRIWIVNVALTLATLGIYSAWAKVRREQYFHRHTSLSGAGFDFDARPIAILRGRILAILLFGGFQLASQLSPMVAVAGGVALTVAIPWMVTASLRFRLHHTLHRGLRFGFRGSVKEALQAYLLWPMAGAATLGVLMPLSIQRQQQFLYGRSAFGGSRFESQIPVRLVYRIFFGTSGIALSIAALGGGAAGIATAWFSLVFEALWVAVFVAAALVAGSYFQVRLHNLSWNHLRLGPHRFASDQQVIPFLALQVTNLVGMLLTLGFFRPWAAVRSARYRAEHLTLVPGASLEEFAAGAQQAEAAAGDEIAELFGFDLGF